MRGYILVIFMLIIGAATAAKITVGPTGEDFPLIQKAVDNASAGDTIEVHSGTYAEHIYLNKALTLMGLDNGKGRPVINASGSGSALILAANGTTVQGFNLTGSGHCGCGNAGIYVQSNNSTIANNILYKNTFGIYVKPGYTNNTIIGNDFLGNLISTADEGGNYWNGSPKATGLQGLMELVFGKQMKGNHYSDYDEPSEGCKDLNNDGLCDQRREISGGNSSDFYPAVARMNPGALAIMRR